MLNYSFYFLLHAPTFFLIVFRLKSTKDVTNVVDLSLTKRLKEAKEIKIKDRIYNRSSLVEVN